MTRVVRRFSIRRMEYEWILQELYESSNHEFEPVWMDIRVLTKLERSLL